MSSILTAVAVTSGVASAALWLWSALVPIPNKTIWFTAHAGGGAPNADIERLMAALRRQSRLSAAAAVFAAVAAMAQIALFVTP